MPTIGSGVREIRIRDNDHYRAISVATQDSAIYVLHAFLKKSQKTRKQDIQASRKALRQLDN